MAVTSDIFRSRAIRRARESDYRRPSWRKLLLEIPAAVRLMVAQLRRPPFRWACGNEQPVMVIPGFLASDWLTSHLRRTLIACGFRAYGWGLGRNLGARADLFLRLGARLDEILAERGRPVALVGWSLGGLYARELASAGPRTFP